MLANIVDHDQMPHYVASDLGLHCLPLTFYGFSDKNGLKVKHTLPVSVCILTQQFYYFTYITKYYLKML